jgi:radical SAM protein with 4Fe4S-binding SPASM domain
VHYYTLEHDQFTSVLTDLEFNSSEPRFDEEIFGPDPLIELIAVDTTAYGDQKLILEKQTGAWCFLKRAEFDVYRSLDGMRLSEVALRLPEEKAADLKDFVARLYWVGLLKIAGRRFIQPEIYRRGPITPRAPLFVVIPTERCNLSCKYCFANSGPKARGEMRLRTAKRIVDLVVEYPTEAVSLDFNGGEALLSIDLIEKTVEYAKERSAARGKDASFYVQTNATLLTRTLVERIKSLGMFVGVSLDGDRPANDAGRVYPNGKGTHSAILRALSLMREEGLPHGLISVVSKANYRRIEEIMDFYRSLGFRWVKLNRIFRQGRARERPDELGLSPEEFLIAHVAYLEYASKREDIAIDWNTNYMIMNIGQKMHSFRCMRSRCGAGWDFFSFVPDGRIFPCDRFRERGELALGHVDEVTALDGIREANPLVSQLFQRLSDNIARCSECRFKRFCEAGCTLDAYTECGTADEPHPWCNYYQGMFEALFEKLAEEVHFARKICPEARPFERIYFH